MGESKSFVLHVAAAHDEHALEIIEHTARLLAAKRLNQILLVLDGDHRVDRSSAGRIPVDIRRICCAKLSIFGKARVLEMEISRTLREGIAYAVHLHGLEPCLLGTRALMGNPLPARILYSPYLHNLRAGWKAALLSRLLQSWPLDYEALAASPVEGEALSKLFRQSAEVLPPPISDIYFDTAAQSGARPNILAFGFGVSAVDVVTRLCVLLNGREARVPFSWIGFADAKSKDKLKAAHVQLPNAVDDRQKSQLLSNASAFIYISEGNQFPLSVAQAMAVGVPCLVSDTPHNRALIRHGETGYVCASERDYLRKLVLLLRNGTERARIGEAARIEVKQRFTFRHFEGALLRAYGFSSSGQLRGATDMKDFVPSVLHVH